MRYNEIRLLVLDVDGTLTDGGIYIDSNGCEIKQFNVKDGIGIVIAKNVGIEVIILTGRESICVEKRATELKITSCHQGVGNKSKFLKKYMEEKNLLKENVAYIGDDLNDLMAMKLCAFSACPSDACEEVKKHCQYIAKTQGGKGAVREIIEVILRERQQWEKEIKRLYSF